MSDLMATLITLAVFVLSLFVCAVIQRCYCQCEGHDDF